VKPISLIVCLFLGSTAFSQKITVLGTVKDKENGSPVQFAQVYFQGTHFGTATNRKGEFIISGDSAAKKTLVISAFPYKTTEIEITTVGEVSVSLERLPVNNSIRLDQIAINRMVSQAVEKIPVNYDSIAYSSTSFHREYIKSFDNLIQYFEAILVSAFANQEAFTELKDAFYVEDKRQREVFWNPSTGGFYTFGWSKLSSKIKPSDEYFFGFPMRSSTDLEKFYSFISKGTIKQGVHTIHVLSFDQKPGIKGSLLKGTLYIDSLSKAIVKLDYTLSPKGYKYIQPNRSVSGVRLCKFPLRIEVIRESGEINFRQFGNKWGLASYFQDADFNASFDSLKGTAAGRHFLKMHSECVVTEMDSVAPETKNISTVRRPVISHDYIKGNFESYAFDESKWSGYNILRADTSVSKVAETLRSNNHLWERKARRKAYDQLVASTMFSPDELTNDLMYMKDMLEALHPGLYDFTGKGEFERTIADSKRRITRSMTESDFYKLLTPVIEAIHCGHTQLRHSEITEEFNKKYGKYFPFKITVNGRKAYLLQDVADTARGLEIIKVNGQPMATVLNNLKDKVSTEGLSGSTKDYFLARTFASLYSIYYDQPDSFKLQLRNPKSRQITNNSFAARNIMLAEPTHSLELKEIDTLQTAILTISDFVSEKDMSLFLENSFNTIQHKGYSHLIIDLRDNDGHEDYLGPLLYSYLSTEPFRYYDRIDLKTADTLKLNSLFISNETFSKAAPSFSSNLSVTDSAITFINHPNLAIHEFHQYGFHGQVYIIVNGGTQSSAAELAVLASAAKRALIIGQETTSNFHGNCNTGNAYLTLPNSRIRVTLPLAKYKLSTANESYTHSLIPDYAIKYSVPDIIERKDKEMETCIQQIVENCCSARSN
jgi:hypothetical protein